MGDGDDAEAEQSKQLSSSRELAKLEKKGRIFHFSPVET